MKSSTSRRGRRGALVAGLCVAGIAAAVGLVVWPGPDTVAVGGCDQAVPLSVAVDPAAAKAVGLVADHYHETHPCRIVNILPWSDDLTAAALSTKTAPDVWVATGASWESAARDAGVEVSMSTTVATTPIVVAMPREAANSLGWSGSVTAADLAVVADPTWQWPNGDATTPWRLGLSRGAGGRDALAGYLQTVGLDSDIQTVSQVTDQWWAASSVDEARGEASAVVTTEQAMTLDGAADRHPGMAALSVQPALSVHVQALVLPAGQAKGSVATDFVTTLASAGPSAWSTASLRTASGEGASATATPTLSPGQPTAVEGPSAEALARALQVWATPSQSARILLMVDYSGSMTLPFATSSDSRLDVLLQALTEAADSAGPHDLVAVYTFQSFGARNAISEIAPGGRDLDDALGPMASKRASGGTPLYRAILDAVETAQEWDGDTRVVIVTDGRQDAADATNRNDVVNALTAAGASTSVVLVGFGANADMASLNDIAAKTGATAIQVEDADQAAADLTTALFG